MSTFCQILGYEYRSNHSIRADCIQSLIKLGYSPEVICKLTGLIDMLVLINN